MKDSASRRSFVAAHVAGTPRSGIREFFDIVSARKDVISLGIGEPDFVTPWHIREAAIYALDHGATSYTANAGLLALRQAIARYIAGVFGVNYDPATEILVTVGVSEALDLVMRATVDPGDEVLYHEPCYVSYGPVAAFSHARPVAVATNPDDGFRLTRSMVERRMSSRARVLLLNFPTNPTGAVARREDIEGLAALAVERDLLVVADEIYSELTYEGERFSIAAMPGMKERTVLLHGFSKGWAMTGFRLGYACGPAELIAAMNKVHQHTMLCAPILSQKAALAALESVRNDVTEMCKAYEQRRNYVCSALGEMGLPCHRPQGAFYAFPRIDALGLSSRDFALRLLDEEHVACVPGSAFGQSGEGFLRCSFATDMDSIKEALRRMGEFVKRLRGRR